MKAEDATEVRYALNRLRDRLDLEFQGGRTDDPAAYLDVRDLAWAARLASASAEAWLRRWKRSQTGPVTNWDLSGPAQRTWLETARPARPYICHTCGWSMVTEAEFARHYVIPNIEYPNTGECWTKLAPEYADKRPEWPVSAIDAADAIRNLPVLD